MQSQNLTEAPSDHAVTAGSGRTHEPVGVGQETQTPSSWRPGPQRGGETTGLFPRKATSFGASGPQVSATNCRLTGQGPALPPGWPCHTALRDRTRGDGNGSTSHSVGLGARCTVRTGRSQAEKATQWVDGGKEGLGHWGTRGHRFVSLTPASPTSSQVSPLALRKHPFCSHCLLSASLTGPPLRDLAALIISGGDLHRQDLQRAYLCT